MSEAISEPGGHRPGRHRRGAAASTWTPVVTRHKNGGRHQADEPAAAASLIAREIDPDGEYGFRQRRPAARQATPVAAQVSAPVATAISGMLPLPEAPGQPEMAQPELAWPTAEPADDFVFAPPEADASDEFAFPWDEADETGEADTVPPAFAASTPSDGEVPVKRTKITLTPLTDTTDNDGVGVYAAPRQDGLSTFDLGNVPASVTPPRSWRKAAWFATVSSGGVVVALLVAASYFVGQPSQQAAVDVDGWTGLRGDQGIAEPPASESSSRSTSSSNTTSQTKAQRISDVAGVHSSSERVTVSSSQAAGSTPTSGSGGTGPSATATRTATPTTTEPQKPPPSSAPRETNSDQFYRFPPNSETMGDRSEIFLNEITEDPERAHEQTGGDLYAEGADGIARRYAHIAYFEVERIYIDQRNRQTVNTVKVVYQDGTTARQQRTLKFGEGDKITSD